MADIRVISILPSQPVQGVQSSQGSGANAASPQITGLPPGTVLNGFIVNRDGTGNPILRTDKGDVVFESNFFLKIGSEVVIRVENTGSNSLAHILSVDGQSPEVAETLSSFAQEPEVIVSQNFASPQTAIPVNETQPAETPVAQPSITLTGTLISPAQAAPGAPPPLTAGSQLTLKIVSLTVPNSTGQATVPNAPAAASSQGNSASYATYARASGAPAVPAAAPALPPAVLPATSSPATVQAPAVQATSAAQVAVANTIATSQSPATVTTATVVAPVTPQTGAPVQQAAPAQASAAANPAVAVTPVVTQAAIQNTVSAPAAPAAAPPASSATIDAAPANPVQAGQTLTATVIGREPSGEALVQTPVGVVRLPPGTVVPNGSSITFTVVDATPPPAQAGIANPTAAAQPAPLTELAHQWTALQQIFSLLSGRPTSTGLDLSPNALPATAQQNAPALPSISPQSLSTGLMVYLGALRANDFRNWLGGNNAQWLEDQGYGNVLKKAESEFGILSRQFTDVQPQHWQPLFFPVAVEGTLQQVRAFIKRDRKQAPGGQQPKGKEDTRFVIEVDLTQLGELQMDGFVRHQGKDIQFDMMIRSLTPLPANIQQDILRIYNDTGTLTGYKGSLVFQSVKEFPVNPMEDIVKHAMGPVTV